MSRISLSSLNRATVAAKEGYWWINGIALVLSFVIARMSLTAYGALADNNAGDRALVCIITQAVAVAAAILARRALTGQMAIAAMGALCLCAGCAWWSSHGLALAWYGDAERNGEPMVIFMAVLEPALFFLAEHIREGREALRSAQARADRETDEALAAARAKDEAIRPKPTAQPVEARQVGEGATVTRLKLVETGRQTTGLPGELGEVFTAGRLGGEHPVEARPPLAAPDHSASTFANAEAHARHLITIEGVRHRNELARRVRGLSQYRAAQLLDELAPDWREKGRATKH